MERLTQTERNRRIGIIKEALKKIEWTTANPDGDFQGLNHGPIEHRVEAERLYNLWRSIANPWKL